MSKREETRQVTILSCDYCGKETTQIYTCSRCKREICYECGHELVAYPLSAPGDNYVHLTTLGESPKNKVVMCKDCWRQFKE